MKHYTTSIFILLILSLDPHLRASWQGSSAARIEWQQPAGIAVTCLSKDSALIQCWTNAPAGRMVVTLGGPLTDGTLRPAAGDVYTLTSGGQAWRAPLRGVVWVPVAKE